jgi:hypothetical protein
MGCSSTTTVTRSSIELPPIPDPPFAWPGPQATAGQPVPVSVAVLHFAWPDNLRARITRSEKKSVWAGASSNTSTRTSSFIMSARPVTDGLLISYSDMKVDTPNVQVTDRVRSALNKSTEALSSLFNPVFVVTREGKFARLENAQQLRADLKSMVDMAVQNATTSNPNIKVNTAQIDEQLSE